MTTADCTNGISALVNVVIGLIGVRFLRYTMVETRANENTKRTINAEFGLNQVKMLEGVCSGGFTGRFRGIGVESFGVLALFVPEFAGWVF